VQPDPPAPGALIDVGGYRVHLNCAGQGTPAVMAIGGFSFDWDLVQPEVAKLTRICTYDASGNAWSEPSPDPTCLGRVSEIHRLLRNANIDGPYILAGFSAGALFARLYARNYPGEVAAMVFVDHAFTPTKVAAPHVEASGPDSPPAVLFATPIEFGAEDEPGFASLPENIRNLHRWAMSRNPARPDAKIADACVSELGNATLGNLPLVVVSTENDAPGYSQLQSRLLALSRNSTQLVADKSFHSIEISQPDVVIHAIRQAIGATRK
jgi:pimeloyl-ACP methyl ester carboxylesterase